MSLYSKVLTSTLAAALGTAAQASALDVPAVQQYISGWKTHSGQQVQRALGSSGTYRDPSAPQALRGVDVAAYVEHLREARFELLDAVATGPDGVRLSWKIVWADRRGESHCVDVLRLQDGAIGSATSTGTPEPAAQGLVAQYIALHGKPTAEGIAALFTPDFAVLSSKSPPGGRRGDDYLQFLQRYRWAAFTQDAARPLQRTKDNRLVLYWRMRFWLFTLASGVDYLTLQDGRIRKVVAVY